MSALGDAIPAGLVHGTAVFWAAAEAGVLILGASGSGKSDLAARLIDRGWRLVADDQVVLSAEEIVTAIAPEALKDTIALPGLGLCHEPSIERARITHIVHLSATAPRFPLDAGRQSVCGMTLPAIAIDGLAASAPLRVERFVKGEII